MNKQPHYIPLSEPIPIREQLWPPNTQPLVHVRTMVFNHEKYLRECIESILNQKTTFPVRMLIHDDASSDQSVAILKEYAEQHPNLIHVYFQQQNTYRIKNDKLRLQRRKPFNDLRNTPYEAICEGDDFWCDDLKLQYQTEFLEANPNYAGCAHATRIQNEDGRKAEANDFWTLQKADTDFTLNDIVQTKTPFHTSSFLFRSHIIPRLLTFPIKVKSGDWLLFTFVALEGKIRYIHRTMSVYRTHYAGITTVDNHFNGIDIELNRYQMWYALKQYAYTQEQRSIFNKMLNHQRKYFATKYKSKKWPTGWIILKALVKIKDWKGLAFLYKKN